MNADYSFTLSIDQNAITPKDSLATVNIDLYDSGYSYYGLKTSIFFTVKMDFIIPEPIKPIVPA